MIIKMKNKINEIDNEELPLNEITQIQLKNKLNDIIHSLPDDLRNHINISWHWRISSFVFTICDEKHAVDTD